MIECGPNYCLDPTTNFSCEKIENQRYGKDKTNNECILSYDEGKKIISECL